MFAFSGAILYTPHSSFIFVILSTKAFCCLVHFLASPPPAGPSSPLSSGSGEGHPVHARIRIADVGIRYFEPLDSGNSDNQSWFSPSQIATDVVRVFASPSGACGFSPNTDM